MTVLLDGREIKYVSMAHTSPLAYEKQLLTFMLQNKYYYVNYAIYFPT